MTYVSTVLADAPIHYWRLADPGGAYMHDIGSSPRALQIGASGQGVVLPYVGPNSDGGAAWIGLGDALNYTDADLALALPVTLECWFWLHHLQASACAFLSVSDGATGLEIGLDATLHAKAFASGGPVTAAAATTRQQWHHLVLTNTAGAANLYLDAFNVGAAAGAAIGAWSPSFVVGGGGNPSAPVRLSNAAIAEVAVYNTALAAGRVTAHYVSADQITSRPVYRGNGTFSTSTGGLVTVPDLAALILSSVRKTY